MNTALATSPGTSMRRTITIIAATISLLVGLGAVAQASGAGYSLQPYEAGFFYGDFDRDLLLFVGATAEDFAEAWCNNDDSGLPILDSHVFDRRDGSVDIKVNTTPQTLYLYSSPLGAPELVIATCGALFDSDPDTVPLQPFAEGEGRIRVRDEIAPDGTVHVVNSTVGAVSSADGTTWRVRGWADLMIGEFGPIGDPADFQGLRVTRTGR